MIKFKFCNFSPKPRLVKEKIDPYKTGRKEEGKWWGLSGKEKIKKKVKWIPDRVFFPSISPRKKKKVCEHFESNITTFFD